jgi:hypothetical protein
VAKTGLDKWFGENWVDIGAKKKDGKLQECGRKSASKKSGRSYPKCVPAAKAASMTAGEKSSAVSRKRSKRQGVGGKPTMVKTFAAKGGSINKKLRFIWETVMKMKAKGYSAGGAPKSRAQRRATLSSAQKNMLDGVQGREGSKQATSVIKDLSDEYGFKPGKRAGAKGGMGKGKRAKPPGMQMGGAAMKTKGYAKGGAAMKTKGYAKGGAAMKTKGAAKGGVRKPSSSKSGLYGRR